ncbi:MAG: hypothetical protein GY880_20685 [Planctomycetaceae bacterium]|nr:hypothetical protein [Planctomycetaceae bacterium]
MIGLIASSDALAAEAIGNLMGLAILGLLCWWIWTKIDASSKRSQMERELNHIRMQIEEERLARERKNR